MKLVVCTLLALAAVTQAGVVRFENEGVSNHDIDLLIRDALIAYRKFVKAKEPIPYDIIPVLVIDGLKVQLKNTKVWIGETTGFTESISKKNNHLSVSVDITQGHGRFEADIAITGKGVKEEGKFKLVYPHAGQKISVNAHFDKKSVKIAKVNLHDHQDVPIVKISGVKVHGMTNKELEKKVSAAFEKFIKEQQDMEKKQTPIVIESLNRRMEGHNLQDVYNYLRKQVPRVSH